MAPLLSVVVLALGVIGTVAQPLTDFNSAAAVAQQQGLRAVKDSPTTSIGPLTPSPAPAPTEPTPAPTVLPPTEPTPAPTVLPPTEPTPAPTVLPPTPTPTCVDDDRKPDLKDCHNYLQCEKGVWLEKTCFWIWKFDSVSKKCSLFNACAN